jgi:small subunit ribosomal protein S8
MATNDTLAVALGNIMNAERVGKDKTVVSPVSKITTAVLDIMKEKRFIGEYEIIDDGKGGLIEINLIGGINKCGVIKPRFACKLSDFDKFEKRFLPAAGFGFMVVSTSKGIMTQDNARENKIGGKLLAFVY